MCAVRVVRGVDGQGRLGDLGQAGNVKPRLAGGSLGDDGEVSDTALLIMDVQQGVVDRYPAGSGRLLEVLSNAAAAARVAGMPVLYVRVAFRVGTPEISGRNRSFAALAETGGFGEDDAATRIHPALTPRPGDVVVTTKRVSAFTGRDLDVVLRSLGVQHLVLGGIATSGVVLSTVRQAADLATNSPCSQRRR